jgi:SAM-dependent methyltransferase
MAAIEAYSDLAAWRDAQAREAAGFDAEYAGLEAFRRSLTPQGFVGYCVLCDATQRFLCPELAGGQAPSLRESLVCARCRNNARQRAAAGLLIGDGSTSTRTYVTEQAGPLYRALRRRVADLVGSEYAQSRARRWRLRAWLWRHGLFEPLRFGDVTALPFANGSFDSILSLDVLEHVPEYRAALREFARVLRPGGTLVLSVPFYADREGTGTLARIDAAGRIEHLQPPEYHGDPLGGGVLCFHHFGWDLLAAMRESGFASAEAVRVCDRAQGCPEPIWLLRARR